MSDSDSDDGSLDSLDNIQLNQSRSHPTTPFSLNVTPVRLDLMLPMRGLSESPSRCDLQERGGREVASNGTSTASSSILDDDEDYEEQQPQPSASPAPALRPLSGFKLALPLPVTSRSSSVPPLAFSSTRVSSQELTPPMTSRIALPPRLILSTPTSASTNPSPAYTTRHEPLEQQQHEEQPPHHQPSRSTSPPQGVDIKRLLHTPGQDDRAHASSSAISPSNRIIVELISQAFCIHLSPSPSSSFASPSISLEQQQLQQQNLRSHTSTLDQPFSHHQQPSSEDSERHSSSQQLSPLALPSLLKASNTTTYPTPTQPHATSHRSTISSRCSSSLGVSPAELSFFELRALPPGQELPSSCRHIGVMVERSGFSLSAMEDLLSEKRNGEQLSASLAAEQRLLQQAHAGAALQAKRATEQEAASAKLQERCRTLEQENAALRHQLQKGDAQYTQMYQVITTLRHEFLELKQDIVGASPSGQLQQMPQQPQQARSQRQPTSRSNPESTP